MEASTQVDHLFWSKLDTWSYRDAALLLCGYDPDNLRGAGIRLDGRELPAEFGEASKVYRILKSAAAVGQTSIHPFTVIEQALAKGLPLPAPLLETVRERFRLERQRAGRDVDDQLNESEAAEPGPRSKRFMLRLIYVMAIQGYGFKLDTPFNDAGEVVADAERLGLTLDRSTIARYLREARQQAESLNLVD